eukprot:SAG31_NODE_306_length_17979_cov_7.825447_4_plen_232_part_00
MIISSYFSWALLAVGAFYTDGEIGDRGNKGDNFWSMRGSRIVGNTFKNIRTGYVGTKGPGGLSAQGVYLDDMVSGYEVTQNRFINCSVGSFVGGGRDNHIHDNYYESCDIAQHVDDRGMNWDHAACQCTNGTGCAPAVAWKLVSDPAGAKFVAAYPQVKTAVLPAHGGVEICKPAFNRFENNVYCRCGRFLDMNVSAIQGYDSIVHNNTEACLERPAQKTDDTSMHIVYRM